MNTRIPYIATLGLLAAASQVAPALAAAGAAGAECRQGELVRTIEVVYASPGHPVPCEVLYAKQPEGTLETLWQASNEAGYCEARAAEFVTRLESLGWSCAEAAAAPVEDQAAPVEDQTAPVEDQDKAEPPFEPNG